MFPLLSLLRRFRATVHGRAQWTADGREMFILFPPSHCPSPERELVSSQELTLKHRLQSPQGLSLNCKADIFLQNQWGHKELNTTECTHTHTHTQPVQTHID